MALYAKLAVADVFFSIDRPYDYRVPPELEAVVKPGCRVMVPFGRGNRRCEALVLALSEHSDFSKVKTIERLLDETALLSGADIRLALWMRERFYATVYEAVRTMLPAGLWFSAGKRLTLAEGVDRKTAFQLVSPDSEAGRLLTSVFDAGGFLTCEDADEKSVQSLVEKGLLCADDTVKRRVGDQQTRIAKLCVSAEELEATAHISHGKGARLGPMQRSVLALLASIEQAPVKEICYLTGASPATITSLVKKGFLRYELEPAYRRPAASDVSEPPPLILNDAQTSAFGGIRRLLDRGEPFCALLQGVTGSGKTSVYIKLLEKVIETGGGAIVLVPEIALTPQLMSLFTAHFGQRAALLHSGLSLGERLDEWKRIKAGLASVVVGTRSAVFAPVHRLRLIIMDEEQEHTYKSENAPRYHAREVAKFRCVQAGAGLLLGSATPSIESAYHARSGRYSLFLLAERFNQARMPVVTMADLRHEIKNGNASTISSSLAAELANNLEKGEQSILFLNRRGMHRLVTCDQCGQTPGCPRCSVSLTYHAANGRLMCHYCGFSQKLPDRCPSCDGVLRFFGAGTQKAEEDLCRLFPGVPILRMDADTTSGKGAHEAILERFRTQKIPILLGTQMVTKGLDFPDVTLVGVLNADMSLYADDFRAHERTFSLLCQVVGRAGRGHRPGRAVIQTFTPAHPLLLAAARQDFDDFYENEIALRKMQGTPPFGEMTTLRLFGTVEQDVMRAASRLRDRLDRELGSLNANTAVFGPAPASILKLNNRYRYHITLCCASNHAGMRQYISACLTAFHGDRRHRGVSLYADVHPNSF